MHLPRARLIAPPGLVAAALISVAAWADSGPIENVLISKSDGMATVEVRFSCAHRYVMHAPQDAADRAEIILERLDRCATKAQGEPQRQATRPGGRSLADLAEIEYQARDSVEAQLILQFERAVRVDVQQTGDLRMLRIAVRSAPGGTVAAAPPVPLPPPAAGPAPRTAERLAHADEVARARLAQPVAGAAVVTTVYAINLESSQSPLDPAAVAAAPGQRAYVTDTEAAGQVWHQLRLGFFASEAQAEAAAVPLRASYPGAWIVRVSAEEQQRVGGVPAGAVAGVTEPGFVPRAATRTLSDAQLAALMAEARAAILAKDHARAVQLCTKLLSEPDHPYSRDAQELLGLARERNGQFAHAVAEYRRYLELYPEGEGAERVQQRLSALTTARDAPKSGIGATATAPRDRWDAYGGFAQYYRRDTWDFDGQGTTVTQSSVLSDGDFVVRRDGDRIDFSSRATIGHLWDLLGEDEGTGDQGRIYNLYLDLSDQEWDTSARLGRQTLRSGGVLGRFDGAHLSWQMRPATRLNFMTGYPVYLPSDSPDSSRVFYGVSADFAEVLEGTDATLFYNTQEVDGIEDRQALGGEVRYFDESRSLVAMVDYDIGYSELNALMALGNWTFENRVTVNAMVDYRQSPFLTTENALIGQPASSIDDLLLVLTEDEIRQLAADRSGEMQTYGLGVAAPVSERFQVSADLTVTQLDGTPASGGVPGFPDLGTEYYYYVSLIGTSLFTAGDVSILGLRYTDGDTAQTSTVFLDTRYPLTERLRINPRLALSLRDVTSGDADQWLARPALRLFYRMARRWQLEMDLGGEWSSTDSTAGSTDTSGWYLYMGYRTDF